MAKTYGDHDTRLTYAVGRARRVFHQRRGGASRDKIWESTHAVSAPHSIVYSMSRSITVSDLP